MSYLALRFQKSRRLLAALLLVALVAVFLAVAGSAFAANGDWQVMPPSSVEDLEAMSKGKGLETVSSFFITVVQWLFGIVGVLMGVAALFVGVQVALGAGGTRREEALQKLWHLILGMCVCFGAWTLVAVFRGLFIK